MWKRRNGFVLLIVSAAVIPAAGVHGDWNPLQDPALLGWWSCDEGTGGVVADSSPNGRDGTFVNGSPAWTTGVYGNAVRLIRPTLVQIPPLDLTLSEATMAGWFRPYGVQPEWASIIMHRNPGLAHGFNLLADRRLAYHWNDMYDSWSFRGSAYYAADDWTFCAMTVEPSQATFYVNGSAASVSAITHWPATWDGPVWLGGDGNYNWVDRRMNGALDDVSFFRRALTQAEIQTLMLGLGTPAPLAVGKTLAEDFETDDFGRFPWVQGGNLDWQISSLERHRGLYSAVSGPIQDSESSVLRVTLTCVTGNITFYRKVSSEAGCDSLVFFIDGEERARWSGQEDWAEVTFPVAHGRRVFEWVYTKDGSESKGADAAWIDDITFPLDAPVELPPAEPQGFDLYVDGTGPSVLPSRPPNVGLLNYYCQDDPAGGSYCIHWTGVDQYGRISFQFKSVKDLSAEVGQGFAVELWTRCNNPSAEVDIRFLDTKTGQPGDRPWRMRHPVNSSLARWTGEWNRLVMPLRQFSEHGAWDENAWWPPIGAFDWKAIDWFEIVAEYYSLQGIHFYFDTIRVIPPGVPG